MSKITTRLSIAIAATLLSSGAAMAQGSDFASMVIDYGYAPGLNNTTVTVAAKPAAAKPVVVASTAAASKARAEVVAVQASAQADTSNADAELGFFAMARKPAPAATLLAGK